MVTQNTVLTNLVWQNHLLEPLLINFIYSEKATQINMTKPLNFFDAIYYLLSDFKYNLEISTKFRPFQNISTLQRLELEISLCPTLNLKPQNWKYLGMQQLQSSHHLPGHTKRHFLLRPQHFSHVICIPPLLLAKTMLLPFHRIFDLVLLYLY